MYFWIGLVVGGALIALVYWLKSKDITLRWYEWLLGVLVIVLGAIAGQHYIASNAGSEGTSALLGGLLFIGLAIIFALIVSLSVWRRQRA